jgi:hypothetical protein
VNFQISHTYVDDFDSVSSVMTLKTPKLCPVNEKSNVHRKAQTSLVRFVVGLLWICCTAFRLVVEKSKAILHCIDFSRFVVESTTSPLYLDMSKCYGFVVDLVESRKVVDLLWILCGFSVQLVVQQIDNKWQKWSLSLKRWVSTPPGISQLLGEIET